MTKESTNVQQTCVGNSRSRFLSFDKFYSLIILNEMLEEMVLLSLCLAEADHQSVRLFVFF